MMDHRTSAIGIPGSWRRALLIAAVSLAVPARGNRVAAQQDPAALTIEQAVRTALTQSRQIHEARLGLSQAREQVSEAWSAALPSVDFNASYQRNVSPAVSFLPAIIFNPDAGADDFIPVRFGADNQWASTISLEQKIFSPDVFVGVGAAGRFEDLQREALRGTTQAVVTQVRLSYYQLLLAQEQRRLTDNSLRRVRQSLKETQAMNRAGLSSDYDVLRLQVQLANLEPNLRRAENAIAQARRQLAIQLDFPEDTVLKVEGSLASMDLDSVASNTPANRRVLSLVGFDTDAGDTVGEALRQAEQMRSDLRQSRLNESLSRSQMRLEQVAYLPKLTFFGNYVIQAQQNGRPDFFGSSMQRAYSRAVGLRVTLPIFQGLRRDARIDQKRSALRQAETAADLARAKARSEVTTLVEQADESFLRARGQRLAVTQAQRGFDIASAQYREGLSSQLELTDAEVALRQSEFNYAQAVYDYLVARAQLDQATGNVPLVDVGSETAR